MTTKRDSNSIDGQLLNFFKTYPISPESTLADAVKVILKAYWLPLVLYSMGVRGEKLRLPTIWALHQLEAQATLIRIASTSDGNRYSRVRTSAYLG